jgi:hypothetical protein
MVLREGATPMKIERRPTDNNAPETIELAADMAWDAAKRWHMARDMTISFDAAACRAMAEDVYTEWAGEEIEDVRDISAEVLSRLDVPASSQLYLIHRS